MDGLTFLKKLMAHYPVPVIMCSSIAPSSSEAALAAVELGAVDIVAKPSSGGTQAMREAGIDLAEKIRAAAVAMKPPPPIPASAKYTPQSFQEAGLDPNRHLVAVGASTGGTEAIKTLLSFVPADFPPTVMVQHMPEGFTHQFARRLDQFSQMHVSEAVDGDILKVGHAYLARGGTQMRITPSGIGWRILYGTSELVNRHCPSVDVLFDSVAKYAGGQSVGILLTGMGADGAQGLLNMRQSGAITFAQNEESCVVYGMPKVAVELGAAMHTGRPDELPQQVLRSLCELGRK